MTKSRKQPLTIESPKAIEPDILETFPYQAEDVIITQQKGNIHCKIIEETTGKENDLPAQTIHITTDEFSAVCPFSGLPDIGELKIEYIPRRLCIELKSLKYYLLSYRNVGIYQEHATKQIFSDLGKVLEPQYLKVALRYNIRGGMLTECCMETDNRIQKGDQNGQG